MFYNIKSAQIPNGITVPFAFSGWYDTKALTKRIEPDINMMKT